MALHVLDVLNLSNGRNLDADSGLRLQREFLLHAVRQRPDLFIHVLAPRHLPPWFTRGLPRSIRFLYWDMETRQRGGAFQFDPAKLSELIDLRNYEIDVVWVNHPELVNAYLFLLNRAHFLDVHSFCYVHWMDWRKWGSVRNRRNDSANLAALSGMLASRVVGCNSEFGRRMILKSAKPWLSDLAYERLERRLVPLYPGIETRQLERRRAAKGRSSKTKTIVFPFRALRYTGFPYLIDHLARLWKVRRDFRLILTDPSQSPSIQRINKRLPFVEVQSLARGDYIELLWSADIVVGMHNGWNQWSLSAVEALACDCIPLFTRESFYPEMLRHCCSTKDWEVVSERFLYYRSQFTTQLNAILDNVGPHRDLAARIGRRARRFYNWEHRAQAWTSCFDLVDQETPSVTHRSATAAALVEHVNERGGGGCGKDELLRTQNWHVRTRQVPWSRFRKHLQANVHDSVDHDGRTIYSRR